MRKSPYEARMSRTVLCGPRGETPGATRLIILVATRERDADNGQAIAEQEKAALAAMLSETLGLSLSERRRSSLQ